MQAELVRRASNATFHPKRRRWITGAAAAAAVVAAAIAVWPRAPEVEAPPRRLVVLPEAGAEVESIAAGSAPERADALRVRHGHVALAVAAAHDDQHLRLFTCDALIEADAAEF